MIKFYKSSKGVTHVISEMPYPYLKNATLKAERDWPHHEETIALRAELDRRDLENDESSARQSSY